MEHITDLSRDVPALLGRRHFLTLLGAGTAAAVAIPGKGLAGPETPRGRDIDRGPSWVFEDPPVEQDPHPGTALLNQNENQIAPSYAERQAMERALDLANRYPEAEGTLVEDLAAMHGVDTSSILMGCGSTELLKVCADALLAPGRELLQAYPTYPTIERYGRVQGADIVSVPVDREGRTDLDAMAGHLGPRTGVVYLCNPNNPSGTVLPDDRIRAFLEKVPPWALIVCDEAYHEYVDDPGYRSLKGLAVESRNLVVLRTFSKVYGLAGMRIGYAVGHRSTIGTLAPHRLAINLNNPGLHAAIAALQDRAFVEESVKLNAQSRARITREIVRFGGRPVESQAGFVWVEFDTETGPIRRALEEHHVYVRTYGHSPKHLRISTGTERDMDRLFDAMEKVVGR